MNANTERALIILQLQSVPLAYGKYDSLNPVPIVRPSRRTLAESGRRNFLVGRDLHSVRP